MFRALSVAVSLLFAGVLLAQQPQPPQPKPNPSPHGHRYFGKVTAASPTELTLESVRKAGVTKTFKLSANTKVWLDKKQVTVADLKAGQFALVRVDPSTGEAVMVRAFTKLPSPPGPNPGPKPTPPPMPPADK